MPMSNETVYHLECFICFFANLIHPTLTWFHLSRVRPAGAFAPRHFGLLSTLFTRHHSSCLSEKANSLDSCYQRRMNESSTGTVSSPFFFLKVSSCCAPAVCLVCVPCSASDTISKLTQQRQQSRGRPMRLLINQTRIGEGERRG